MNATAPQIQNIKGHFYVSCKYGFKKTLQLICANKHIKIKFHHNFAVVRNKFVYIIWYERGFVNVTKIKSISKLHKSMSHFCKLFKVSSNNKKVTIDNITASGKFHQCINLKKLALFLEAQQFQTRYNRYKFPAIFVKIYKHGTLTIFGSGSFNIVGCRSLDHLSAVYNESVNNINQWKNQNVNII